ncbi:MAG: 5-formyltetrahydrofolate cyclo-ligase [Gallionellales bacterium RIFCSPLOWO2_02_FULL_57_47]|nr:MAG: 5-formyltetrahydrofolate cyclo-ligase [Gallionellales bacterium RIFCSPLOWO2_02_FULL_57_47]OGT14963.1 MAG: 5-formyltetrahydrofolate cyclo-ligase [Gallionellales bacterium RIFCSPHIGHO2_02_FULL_57_16]
MPLSLKQVIRKSTLSRREHLPASVRAAHSASITERLMQLPEYRQAEAVLGYMNFGAEFASELWVERVLAEGKRLALPKVNHHTNQLDLYWVDDPENQLAAGLWGIREPVVERCERLNGLNEVEFVLLPGVAFARDGARLGYGRGFYDKLLMKQLAIRPSEQTALAKPVLSEVEGSLVMSNMTQRPVLAAAAFSLQIVEFIPQEATDVKVEWIITEQETIACSVND